MNISEIKVLPKQLNMRRGFVFGFLIVAALIAFEIFNYSSTDFALADLLGDLRFLGVRWSTILAIAFCGIDFAGIARLFTPEKATDEPTEVWYLFGAWMLAATMNAMLTWWGVSTAIFNHETLGNAFVTRGTLLKVVPLFVAIMVWLIRVLIIGTISVAGERLFSQGEYRVKTEYKRNTRGSTTRNPVATNRRPAVSTISRTRTPAYRPIARPKNSSKPEPTYSPISMSGRETNRIKQSRF